MPLRAGKKVLTGALAWAALVAAVAVAFDRIEPATRARLDHVRDEAWRTLRERPPEFRIRFTGGGLLEGDRPGERDKFIERGNGVLARVDGRVERVGEVARKRREGDDLVVTIALDTERATFPLRQGARAVRRSQGRSFVFAAQSLLTDARRVEVARRWQEFRAQHEAALLAELQPVVTELMQGGAAIVEEQLPEALGRHRAEVDALLTRLQAEVGRDQLLPLLAEEIWPIVARHAKSPAETIGRELWDKVPLFDIAMRAAADKVLEKEPVRVEKRWRTFLEDEAVPTLQAHEPEMTAALAAIARDVLQSEPVHARVSAVLRRVTQDPDAKKLTSALSREVLFENPRLNEFVRAKLAEPDVRARLQRVSERVQEFLDPIGDLLLLDDSGQGINPDLARLIRLFLLHRDAQVIDLDPGDGPPLLDGSEIEGRHES
jgi:hypothetical protein